MINPPVVQSLETWIKKFTIGLTLEVYKLTDDKTKNLPGDTTRRIATQFMAQYLGTAVFKELSRKAPDGSTKEEAYEFACKNLSDLKKGVEEAVAVGFAEALSQYSARPVEYFCKISPVPEGNSKYVC